MSDLFLGKMSIQNFKLIDSFILDINLMDYNLIMLDGPNGFGKTTLFDALELMITGTIQRIRSDDGRTTFGSDLFRKNPNQDCIIKMEFCSSKKKFTLLKRLKATTSLQRFRTEDFFKFETFLLPSFDSQENEYRTISQYDISEMFNVPNLERFYNLFYYIQQEENAHFLKRKSKERMDAVSQLFDTKPEEEEKQKLMKLQSKLKQLSTKVTNNLTETKKRYNYLKNELQTNKSDNISNVTFQCLLSHLENSKPWDIEMPVINTRESRDTIIKELRSLEDFKKKFQDFLNAKHNDEIEKALKNKLIVKYSILAALHINKFDEIENTKQVEDRLRELLSKLSREAFLKDPSSLNIEILSEIGYPINNYADEIKTLVTQIITDQKVAGNLAVLNKELIEVRDQFIDKFIQLTKSHTHVIGSDCPLCGQSWKEQNILIKSIDEKKQDFLKFYDEATKRIDEATKELYDNHFQKIIRYIEEYLLIPNNTIENEYFKELSKANKEKARINKFIEWSSSKGISIEGFLQKERVLPEDLSQRLDSVIQQISTKRIPVDDLYDVGSKFYNDFSSLYKENFNNSSENVKAVTIEQIRNKISYIEHMYFTGNTTQLQKVETEILALEDKIDKIGTKISGLKDIIQEYDTAIKQHWNRIMKDIEIPFYIYSGKIIQYYQKGLGVFIKEAELGEAKNIKFVSNDSSEHDAINYFSSGQISSLVISFTLALNKIYSNDGLGMILIDDPVQTMDELNMASLTELLRNEFPNKQIVLSTHEDHVSRYIRYKFQKYGKNTLQFNVKRELVN